MSILQVVVLALIQGLTEFLPVSSSAHLILPSQLLDWPDQGIFFDVAVHVGTLMAVVCYYFSDLLKITSSTLEACIRRKQNTQGKIGFCIILATIPVCISGFLFESQISTWGRSIEIIAWATIGYGVLLGLASYVNRHLLWHNSFKLENKRPDSLHNLTYIQALIIGLAQALSIVPGTSRSGITLTAGLFLGMSAQSAARFSFLLSIPVIIASASLELLKLYLHPELLAAADILSISLGVMLSFLTALTVIHLFMRYIAKSGMAIFVIYRLLLGALLLWVFH
ncbi:MAG: undecaprenyl-diphosphate phosphatase [Succinatimonas sp.]|nr:undecaprenyl-diphosphate phosphatase [Succinatimonas sp.]